MIKVDGYQITMPAGDTLKLDVGVRAKVDGKYIDYEPDEGDVIQFTLKDDTSDQEPIYTVIVQNDTKHLVLSSQQTAALEPRKKPYPFDIKLIFTDGTVDTFIKGKLFIVE